MVVADGEDGDFSLPPQKMMQDLVSNQGSCHQFMYKCYSAFQVHAAVYKLL